MDATPSPAADLLAMGAAGVVVGFALCMALQHLIALIRERRARALFQKSTLFKYHL